MRSTPRRYWRGSLVCRKCLLRGATPHTSCRRKRGQSHTSHWGNTRTRDVPPNNPRRSRVVACNLRTKTRRVRLCSTGDPPRYARVYHRRTWRGFRSFSNTPPSAQASRVGLGAPSLIVASSSHAASGQPRRSRAPPLASLTAALSRTSSALVSPWVVLPQPRPLHRPPPAAAGRRCRWPDRQSATAHLRGVPRAARST